MSVKLPLSEMSIQEKLAMMETLWEDLSSSPRVIESPEWQEQLLAERREEVEKGTAQFVPSIEMDRWSIKDRTG